MDTVEISEEGRAASAQTQNRQAETKAAAAEAEQYEGEDLSEYADAELKQMYYKGEITRQEYEDETGEEPDQLIQSKRWKIGIPINGKIKVLSRWYSSTEDFSVFLLWTKWTKRARPIIQRPE